MELSERKVTREEIETLPEGIYEIDEPRGTVNMLISATGEVSSLPTRLVAMIDGRNNLPDGTESAYFRKDGLRVVIQGQVIQHTVAPTP